jgi:hypothetical protein
LIPLTHACALRRNQRKKAALASSKEACSALQAENRALLQQLEDSTQEAYQVSEHFRQELLAKNARIGQLQQQCEQVGAHGRGCRKCPLPPGMPTHSRAQRRCN